MELCTIAYLMKVSKRSRDDGKKQLQGSLASDLEGYSKVIGTTSNGRYFCDQCEATKAGCCAPGVPHTPLKLPGGSRPEHEQRPPKRSLEDMEQKAAQYQLVKTPSAPAM